MLEEREQLFIDYWEANRLRESRLLFQLLTGLPIGLLFSLPIILLLFTSRFWYKRADMVANTELSYGVLIGAVLGIAVFVAVLYKRHQWDRKEQQYLEIKRKQQKNS